MLITSLENENVKLWKKLRTKKYILENNKYIVEGEHLTEEAIKSGKALEIILLEGENFETDLPVTYVNEKVISSISFLPSAPKIMCVCEYKKNNEIIGNKIILLDDVQDPGNVGTIIRSALAFEVDTIIISGGCASLTNDKVIRSTGGAIFHVNVVEMNIETAIKNIKEKGIKVYGACANGNIELSEVSNEKYAIILGNEGNGIKKEILKLCDDTLKITINEKCESLNVAVTGGIIMFSLR